MKAALGRLFGSLGLRAEAAADPLSSVELRAGGSRVVILPALGGKISEMEIAGRDWLWKSDTIPFRRPRDGESYVETADSGGYDECFPTVGACALPPEIERYAGLALPDHGELWSQPAAVQVETNGGPPSATCEWQGRRMAYLFERRVTVESDGAVRMRYRATNAGSAPLPFIWSSHPLIALTPETRIVLPEGAPVRVYAQHHIDLFGVGAEHRWPRLRTKAGPELDASRPDEMAKRFACKLFLDMPEGRAAIRQGGAELACAWNAREVPNFGLWLNKGGWWPFRGRSRYRNLAFEPCIGAPDTLGDALGDWQSAHWLAVGETRSWELVWTGSADQGSRIADRGVDA
ncbi:MAG: hypothetical protein ABJD07_04125 [Gemmatimonadaceae bacterium]